MSKKLKIAFAMGGGVSLGSFSGAALTESLKLLLLYGQDEEGNPYSGIEIDAMSGASAGAISLLIMLKAIINYESYLEKWGISKEQMIKDLENEYGLKFDDREEQFKDSIIALEVSQILQKKIWVEDLEINKLVEGKINRKDKIDINKPFGLFSRENVKNIVSTYLFEGLNNISSSNLNIISKKRFLFACSLSNLLPIKSPYVLHRYNSIKNKAGEEEKKDLQLVGNLLQSISSYGHKELRVVDFLFDKDVESDERWLKIYLDPDKHGVDIDNQMNYDIKKIVTWKVLAASVIACGAFPIAFEPAVLKRFKDEYGGKWNINFSNSNLSNCYTDGGENKLRDDEFNFPYVDGGTFNNEPIREAFRLANFIDYNDPRTEKNQYDRIIIFVDPIVSISDPSFNIKSFGAVQSSKLKDFRIDYKESGEINKAINVTSKIISMLQRQGSIKEEHKSDTYVEHLELSNALSNYLKTADIKFNEESKNIVKLAIEKIATFLDQDIIPDGTRNSLKFIDNFIIRNKASFPILSEITNVERLNIIKDFQKMIFNKCNNPERDEMLKVCFMILSNISLNTLGKDKNALRIGITPHDINSNKTIKLPGVELQAFAGFVSKTSREYSFEYGKLCAYNTLKSNIFRFYYNEVFSLPHAKQNIPFISTPKGDYEKKLIDKKNNIARKETWESYGQNLANTIYDLGQKRILKMIKLNAGQKILPIILSIFSSIIVGPAIGFHRLALKILSNGTIKSNLKLKISDQVKHIKLIPITIKIVSPKINSKIVVNRIGLPSLTINGVYIKKKRSQKQEMYFKLFILEGQKDDSRINFYVEEYYEQIEEKNKSSNNRLIDAKHIVKNIVLQNLNENQTFIDSKDFDLIKEINSNKYGVKSALKRARFFINPAIQIEFYNDKNPEFSFIENTIPLRYEL